MFILIASKLRLLYQSVVCEAVIPALPVQQTVIGNQTASDSGLVPLRATRRNDIHALCNGWPVPSESETTIH